MTWPGSRSRLALVWMLTASLAWGQEALEDQDPIEPDWTPAWDTPFWPAPSGAVLELAAGHSGQQSPFLLNRLGQAIAGDYVLALLTLPLAAPQRPLAQPSDGESEEAEVEPEARPPRARPEPSTPNAPAPEDDGTGPAGASEPAAPRPRDAVSRAPEAEEVPLELVEDALNEADKAAGFGGSLRRLGAIRQRARWSGLAPELRLRGATGIDQTRSIDSAGVVPSDETLRDGSDSLMEIRLTFHLERLLHAGPEVALERARQDVLRDRAGVRSLVGKELVTYVRERRRLAGDLLDDEAREKAEHSAEQARLALYLLTDGWFRGAETLRRYEAERPAPLAGGRPQAGRGDGE